MTLVIGIALAFGIALAGGVVSALVPRTHDQLCAFIGLGSGALLGVALLGIAPECLASLTWWQALPAAGLGYILFSGITKYVYPICPACAASRFDEPTAHRLADFATAMMIALAVHCVVDGVGLAVGHNESPSVNLSVTIALCAHKLPEGLALGALLLAGGVQRSKMLWLLAAVESMTIVGGALGWFFLQGVSGFWLAMALAWVGGGFVYLAGQAVIGILTRRNRNLVLTNLGIGLGGVSGLLYFLHP